MTLSLRINDDDALIIKRYAELKNVSVSEFIRNAVMEQIDNELDLRTYESAMEEYQNNPKTYTLDEMEKELNLQ